MYMKNNYGFNSQQKLLTVPFYFIPFVSKDLANGTMKSQEELTP